MKFKMISDTAARVQVKGDILDEIMQPLDKYHGGTRVTKHGCWIRKSAGGWVTIAAFGSDAQAESDLVNDLMALREALDKDVHPDLKD